MGQKVHPIGLRVGIIRDWDSKWYSEKEFATNLHEDFKIREFITKKLKDSSVSKVEIDRFDKKVNISVHTAKPGMVIGKGGAEIDKLRLELNKLTGKRVHINVVEIKKSRHRRKTCSRKHSTSTRSTCIIPSCSKTSYSKNNESRSKRNKNTSIRTSRWS